MLQIVWTDVRKLFWHVFRDDVLLSINNEKHHIVINHEQHVFRDLSWRTFIYLYGITLLTHMAYLYELMCRRTFINPFLAVTISLQESWFCHFDDDTYVNIKNLLTLLDHFDPKEAVYLGKAPSRDRATKTIVYNTQKRRSQTEVKSWFLAKKAFAINLFAMKTKMLLSLYWCGTVASK